MDTIKLLNAIWGEFLKELRLNQDFRTRIVQIIEKNTTNASADEWSRRSRRRKPGPFDPMAVYREQPETLKSRLEDLEIEELKDIIAEHGMDKAKLAMKWKSKERLIDLIITTIQSRSQKGDVFRTP